MTTSRFGDIPEHAVDTAERNVRDTLALAIEHGKGPSPEELGL